MSSTSEDAPSRRWTKRGLVFKPDGRYPWLRTHAALPLSLSLAGGRRRIYFASRDEKNRSHVGWVEIDMTDPGRVVAVAEEPALAPGPLGHFDDHGVYPASIVEDGGRLLLYYIGWNPGPRQPLFTASIGLAMSSDGGRTFERTSPAPILARSRHDPCLVTSPCVLRDRGRWRMWYVSGIRWDEVGAELRSFYHVKYAESSNGVDWEREGRVCIELEGAERNIARPCVRVSGGRYEMWYGRSGDAGYRLGYARSDDGLAWRRMDDQVGLDLSPSGWDSEAMTYPWVFESDGRLFMLYNGNQFGREGFGLAVEDVER